MAEGNRPAALAPAIASESGNRLYLVAICLVAAIGGLLFGFETAVVNGAIERLDAQYAFSDLLKGMVVSSALVGCLFGAAIAGTLGDRFGRKPVLLLSATLFVISAVGCTFPVGPFAVQCLIIARFLGGTGIGIASTLSPLYIAEIAPSRLRGSLVATYQWAITIGALSAFLSNYCLWLFSPYASGLDWGQVFHWIFANEIWRGMFLVGIVPGLAFLLLLLLVPESPRWLTKQGESQRAMAILARVSGQSEAARAMTDIQEAMAEESGSVWQLFHAGMRIPLLIGVALPFFTQIAGINVIVYYGETVFKAAGFGENARLLSQVGFGVINVLSVLAAIPLLDKVGRKPVLLIGLPGVCLSLFLGGLLFKSAPGWLPLIFVVYLICFQFSYAPATWVILSEIFPTKVRGRAMSIAVLSLWTGCTLVASTFPGLLRTLGPTYTFWLYAMSIPPAMAFIWFVIPETKGQSLEQIEKRWMH